ncbi:hypothetical protein PAMP_002617 [Pampus punctatissimus]
MSVSFSREPLCFHLGAGVCSQAAQSHACLEPDGDATHRHMHTKSHTNKPANVAKLFHGTLKHKHWAQKLSKAIITALWCKSVLAMADKGWKIVSNDGSTSAETSQSCLFQQ